MSDSEGKEDDGLGGVVMRFPTFPADQPRPRPLDSFEQDLGLLAPLGRAAFEAQQEASAKKFEALELARRQREFIDHVAVQLWVGENPVRERLNEGATTEEQLERTAEICVQEASRLWRHLHP